MSVKTSPEGNAAYIQGFCKVCLTERYRAGGTECTACWKKRGQFEPGLQRRPQKPKAKRR